MSDNKKYPGKGKTSDLEGSMTSYADLLTSDMLESFIKFVESPRRDYYLALRNALISSDEYDPNSDDIFDAEELVNQMAFQAAQDKLHDSMPNLLLSPRAHYLLARTAERIGDMQSTQMESLITSACLKGIAATGDGSKASPYLVV